MHARVQDALPRGTRGCCRGCSSVSVAMLIIPVSLQIFSRYTELIPAYIWTEEMARFLFIWMIMIGAMIGVRESAHFEVDVWPRARAARRRGCCGSWPASFVLAFALVFVWWRHRVHALRLEPHLRAGRAAAVDDPRRLAAHRRRPGCVFLGEQVIVRRCCAVVSGGTPAVTGAVLSPRDGGADPVRRVLPADVRCACRSRSRSASPACRSCVDRAAPRRR